LFPWFVADRSQRPKRLSVGEASAEK
jgi:hypothetical protein